MIWWCNSPSRNVIYFDSSGKWLMGGEKTADNCYGLPGVTTDP